MGTERIRQVPFEGDEKESLHIALDRHRDVVVWKLAGLDEEQARRPLTPSGTSLLGLVKHLASVEYGWFCETFGRESEPLWFDPFENEDMAATDDETTADILAFFARARAAADRAVAELPLDTVGTAWDGRKVSLRWVLVHMVEETARHAGHMDILRELIDGTTGGFPALPAK
ncbi:DinB family protein [Streptomyces sp. Q6]|uniref:DinB family protein n=1 Tax=Streptomyces citrinus TaxID=3118173 RepID=A0ACD5AGF4_9ACTN